MNDRTDDDKTDKVGLTTVPEVLTDPKPLTDIELDRLLGKVSEPPVLFGFEKRLAARLALMEPQLAVKTSNVIAFRNRESRHHPQFDRMLPFAVAMAASLVLGIWLGGIGQTSAMFEALPETAMLGSAHDFAPSGLDEIGDLDVDDLS